MQIIGVEGVLYLFNVLQLLNGSVGIELRSPASKASGPPTPTPVSPSPTRSQCCSCSPTAWRVSWLGLGGVCIWLRVSSGLLAGLVSPRGSDCSEAVSMNFLCLIAFVSVQSLLQCVPASLTFLCFRRQSLHPPQSLSLCRLAVLWSSELSTLDIPWNNRLLWKGTLNNFWIVS